MQMVWLQRKNDVSYEKYWEKRSQVKRGVNDVIVWLIDEVIR